MSPAAADVKTAAAGAAAGARATGKPMMMIMMMMMMMMMMRCDQEVERAKGNHLAEAQAAA
jgi:hypothetical protein